MNAYPLGPLLAVRTFREDAAKREAQSRKRARELARQALAGCQQEHGAYAVWRVAEEKALFDRIQNREVPLSEVEDFKQNVLALRSREQELLEAVWNAEKELDAAKIAEDAAKRAYQQTSREKLKITEHRKIWSAEDVKLKERASEAELEEFQGRGKIASKAGTRAGEEG
jgi:type III secretion protein O